MVSKEVIVEVNNGLEDTVPLIPEKFIRNDEKGLVDYVN